MDRAIAAARRAFDDTDWSTNRELRKRCLHQLQTALEAEKEDLRERAHRRGRLPGDDDAQRAGSTGRWPSRCAIPPG